MTGRLIAVVGPSGVGKDTVMAGLVAQAPHLEIARRVITRPKDSVGEVFLSVTDTEFAARRAAGAFVLWWSAHGLSYGLTTDLETRLEQGHDVLANLSRSVLTQAQARFDRFSVLALTADRQVLAQRLAARGREQAADIALRLTRTSAPLPTGLQVFQVDNSGAVQDTVQNALGLLYPESV